MPLSLPSRLTPEERRAVPPSANARRDLSIADFFNALTGLIKLCEPLIKQAVAEAAAKKGK
jgi:hypothetical protein